MVEILLDYLFLSTKLFKFEIKICGQVLCTHKSYFLMLGHKYNFPLKPYSSMLCSSYKSVMLLVRDKLITTQLQYYPEEYQKHSRNIKSAINVSLMVSLRSRNMLIVSQTI